MLQFLRLLSILKKQSNMTKKTLILFTELKEVFDTLSNEQAGQLIKAIFEYEQTNILPDLEGLLKIVFIPIRQSIDRNRIKYENVCDRNKENIGKRWNKNNTKNTNGKIGINKNTKNTDKDKDSDKDKEKDNNKEKDIIGDTPKTPLEIKFEEFLKFRKAKKVPVLPESVDALKSKLWKLSNKNEDTAIEILNESIANGYQGIFELKNNNNGKQSVLNNNKSVREEILTRDFNSLLNGNS
jgi:hypothetical protein